MAQLHPRISSRARLVGIGRLVRMRGRQLLSVKTISGLNPPANRELSRRGPVARQRDQVIYSAGCCATAPLRPFPCFAFRSCGQRWLRSPEQHFGSGKWTLCRFSGCRDLRQPAAVGVVWRLPVKARMRTSRVVQRSSRTPTGPFAEKFCIGFILGLATRLSSMR